MPKRPASTASASFLRELFALNAQRFCASAVESIALQRATCALGAGLAPTRYMSVRLRVSLTWCSA
jgi:hypothetical protein